MSARATTPQNRASTPRAATPSRAVTPSRATTPRSSSSTKTAEEGAKRVATARSSSSSKVKADDSVEGEKNPTVSESAKRSASPRVSKNAKSAASPDVVARDELSEVSKSATRALARDSPKTSEGGKGTSRRAPTSRLAEVAKSADFREVRDVLLDAESYPPDWKIFLQSQRGEFAWICDHIEKEKHDQREFTPRPENLLKPFSLTSPSKVRVILFDAGPALDWNGDEPEALGYALGHARGTGYGPLALLKRTLGDRFDESLEGWARQGVLLLNAAPIAPRPPPRSRAKNPKNPFDKLFIEFYGHLIEYIASLDSPVIIVLLGGAALNMLGCATIRKFGDPIIAPDPLTASEADFARAFAKINATLVENLEEEIVF